MIVCLTAFLIGILQDDIRTPVPEKPFECAHARSYSFDASGKRMICVNQRSELLKWNEKSEDPIVTTLEKKANASVFDRTPMSAILVNDGTEIILFYHDSRVQVWNFDTGLKIKDLENEALGLGYARLSPNGKLVGCLSRGSDGKSNSIRFWNTRDWSTAESIDSTERINDFCFTSDSTKVLACVGHPTDQKNLGFTGILAFDLESMREVERVDFGEGFPIRIAVSADSRWVATGGGDAVPVGPNSRRLSGHLRVFDWQNKKFLKELYTLESDYVRCLQFSPDSRFLFAGAQALDAANRSFAGQVRAFRTKDWDSEWAVDIGLGNPHELVVSPNGKDILAPDYNSLKILDAKSGTLRGTKLTFKFFPEDQSKVHHKGG